MRVERIQGAYVPAKRRRGGGDGVLGVDGVRVWPDLVKRDFQPAGPNELWCSDLKQIPTGEGVLHLASVLDCFSRRIVGWAMGPVADAPLVADALRMAVSQRRPGEGIVHHADRGCQGGFKRSSQHSIERSCDGQAEAAEVGSGWAAGDPFAGPSPGWRREHRQRFWAAIARGAASEAAGVEAGVSPAVGAPVVQGGDGMPSVTQAPLSGRYLSFGEREEIALLRESGCGVREIARQLGRCSSRSPASCVGTLRLAVAVLSIGRARRSGMRTGGRAVRSRPSWLWMLNCDGMCRIVSLGLLSGLTVARWTVPMFGGSAASCWAPDRAGRSLGARSRSPTGCASTSPMMSRCGSARGDLPVAVCAGPRRAQARADRVPAHGTGAARPASPSAPWEELRDRPGSDQRASGRG